MRLGSTTHGKEEIESGDKKEEGRVSEGKEVMRMGNGEEGEE